MRPYLFAAFAIIFTFELRSFRAAVLNWAKRDLDARTALAADNLHEPLRAGDLRFIQTFSQACESEGARLTIFNAPSGVFFDSHNQSEPLHDRLFATYPADDFTIRLGLPLSRVLAPFHRAQWGFCLTAILSAFGVLLIFYYTYRQRVRLHELVRLELFWGLSPHMPLAASLHRYRRVHCPLQIY